MDVHVDLEGDGEGLDQSAGMDDFIIDCEEGVFGIPPLIVEIAGVAFTLASRGGGMFSLFASALRRGVAGVVGVAGVSSPLITSDLDFDGVRGAVVAM